MSDLEKLEVLTTEIDNLIEKRVTRENSEFVEWHTKTKRLLARLFGDNSDEYNEFKKTIFTLGVYSLGTPVERFISACKRDLEKTRSVFKGYIEDLKDDETTSKNSVIKTNSIFLVHGHDGELKQEVARMIEKQGIKAIILSEQTNQGKTIIEKLEENRDVSAAICLFTKDDLCISGNNETRRARQNVVFETGYFIGKLSRKNVICICEKDVELPSDMDGVVYTDKNSWDIKLLKELKSIGFSIDLNKLCD